MVHELHKAGYQKLRIFSGMNPSGTHWRCHITPASNIGWPSSEPIAWDDLVATYSTSQSGSYFGWEDAKGKKARELARLFITRLPRIAEAGIGQDRAYAGWFVDMLGAAENGRLPIFFADHPLTINEEEAPPPPAPPERPVDDNIVQAYEGGNQALQRAGYPGADLDWGHVHRFTDRLEPFLNWYVAARNTQDPEGKTYGRIAAGIFLEAKREFAGEER